MVSDYDKVDLTQLLDPDGAAEKAYKRPGQPAVAWKDLSEGQRIDLAFAAFHSSYPKDTERKRRDQVQERLLGASNQLCSRYLAYIQSVNSNGNFLLGSLATGAGAAGALLTGGASQALSAAAGALSGVRAEFNQDYFSNLTVAVIASGIKLERQEIYDQITKYGQEHEVDKYPVEAAVKDALFYHGECSLIAGVEKAGDSVKLAADPGLDAVNRVLLKLNIARSIQQTGTTDPSALIGSGGNAAAGQLLMAGTPRGSTQATGDDPLFILPKTKLEVATAVGGVKQKIGELDHLPAAVTAKTLTDAVDASATAVQATLDACLPAAKDANARVAKATADHIAAKSEVDKANTTQALNLAQLKAQGISTSLLQTSNALIAQLTGAARTLTEADAAADKTTPKGTIPDAVATGAKNIITAAKELKADCS